MEYTFNLMQFPEDKNEINNWEEIFKQTDGWNNIYQFILEDGLIHDLNELIRTNYEVIPIGYDEIKLALAIKNSEKEIIGFIICQEFNMETQNPELFLQYIVLRPDMQNKKLGQNILKNLPDEVEKITGVKPVSAFSYIERSNKASQAIYLRCGYDLTPIKRAEKYFIAKNTFEKELEK